MRGTSLGCHGTRTQYVLYVGPWGQATLRLRYVPNAGGWYAYPVRTVRGALGESRPVRPVRTQRGRLVRVACTYPTEAPGRTCQLSSKPTRLDRHGKRSSRTSQRMCTKPPVAFEAAPPPRSGLPQFGLG